ncbi:PREDICTED: hyaluronidase PH-20-like [Dipodomys ordii]|uniref:Hyaluronidase n=1 Tax=Dipodomys ordii TaxID=10020 RepID=A0A1S3FFT8_DIPOR|nr:PREDICTED: hyaluronidase PH-20-like [Dipodomys ordii]
MGMLSFKHLFFGSSSELYGASQTVLVYLLIPCCLTQDFRAPPLIPNNPFLWAWNAPTELCVGKFNEPLDLKLFSFTGSPRKTAIGQSVTIFYSNRLGYYPYIDSAHNSVNGGIPQLGSLQDHLTKANGDILYYMPTDKMGLAVIDWEEWRPIWERNWAPKNIYKNKSIELVQQRNIDLNLTEATEIAKEEFEEAGKKFMLETLRLGKLLRPNRLWGFYLFPDCYNHNPQKPNYSGHCPDIEKKRNDALHWLWEESTALFPSVYLRSELEASPKAVLYVRNRVQEAIRVSKVRDARSPLPIFVYARLVFSDLTLQYLSQEDLVNTIGETVALGASGMVIWGTLSLARNMKSCLNLHTYLETTLNPYLINVTLAAKMCGQVLCQDQGVCTRKHWNSSDYLHLNPLNFEIQTPQVGQYIVHGKPTLHDLHHFSRKFKCSCFANLNCKQRADIENVHAINVCAIDGVCIDAFVKKPSQPQFVTLVAGNYSTYTNNSSAQSCATISRHIPWKDLSGCLLVIYLHLKYLI